MTAARNRPQFTSAVFVTLVGNAVPPIAALVSAPLLAQGLGVVGRGQLAAALSIASLAVALGAFGFPEAVTHFVARRRLRTRRLWLLVAIGSVMSGVLACVVTLVATRWLSGGDDRIASVIVLATGSVLPSVILGLVRGAAAGAEAWIRIALEKTLASLVKLLVIGFMVWGDALTLVAATAIMSFGPLVGAIAYIRLRRPVAGAISAVSARDLYTYGGRVWIGSVSGILLMRVDQSLLVPLSGAYELGLYAVAVAISEIPLVINSSIRDVVFARHSEQFDPERLTSAARISWLLTCVVSVMLALTLPLGVPMLFGREFAPAIPICLLLLFAVAIGTPGSIAGAGLSALGRPGLRSLSLTLACLANVGALALLAPHLGAIGAAYATLIGNIISSSLNIVWLARLSSSRSTDFVAVRRRDLQDLSRLALRAVNR